MSKAIIHFNLHCITTWWKTTSRTWQMNGDCTWSNEMKNSTSQTELCKYRLKIRRNRANIDTLTRTYTWLVTFLAWYRPKNVLVKWCDDTSVSHVRMTVKRQRLHIATVPRENDSKMSTLAHYHCGCKERRVLILKFIQNIFNLHVTEVIVFMLLVNTHDNIKGERWNILMLRTHLFIHFEMTQSCDIVL